MHHFSGQNASFAQSNFFLEKIIIIFIVLLAPFILQNFKKILRANPELWGCAIFETKIPQFVLNKFFWYKPLLLLLSTYWPFLLGKIFKNILAEDPEFWACAIFGPQIVHLPEKKILLENY